MYKAFFLLLQFLPWLPGALRPITLVYKICHDPALPALPPQSMALAPQSLHSSYPGHLLVLTVTHCHFFFMQPGASQDEAKIKALYLHVTEVLFVQIPFLEKGSCKW